jgi:hypothetical protein
MPPLRDHNIWKNNVWALTTGCALLLLLLRNTKWLPTRLWSPVSKKTRDRRSDTRQFIYIRKVLRSPWLMLFFGLGSVLSAVYDIISEMSLTKSTSVSGAPILRIFEY